MSFINEESDPEFLRAIELSKMAYRQEQEYQRAVETSKQLHQQQLEYQRAVEMSKMAAQRDRACSSLASQPDDDIALAIAASLETLAIEQACAASRLPAIRSHTQYDAPVPIRLTYYPRNARAFLAEVYANLDGWYKYRTDFGDYTSVQQKAAAMHTFIADKMFAAPREIIDVRSDGTCAAYSLLVQAIMFASNSDFAQLMFSMKDEIPEIARWFVELQQLSKFNPREVQRRNLPENRKQLALDLINNVDFCNDFGVFVRRHIRNKVKDLRTEYNRTRDLRRARRYLDYAGLWQQDIYSPFDTDNYYSNDAIDNAGILILMEFFNIATLWRFNCTLDESPAHGDAESHVYRTYENLESRAGITANIIHTTLGRSHCSVLLF